METNTETMTADELLDKLKTTVRAVMGAVGGGDGVVVLVVTEEGMRLESFNMDSEELASALDAAYDVVTGAERDEGEVLQ